MASNIRAELVDLPQPVDPNWKSTNILTSKIYPVSSVISATNTIAGNLEFQWTVPAGYRQDVSKSYIVFDCQIAIVGDTALVTTAPAFNMCSAFFSTGRLELNDTLVSSSNNVAQDDTVWKRLTKSYVKYTGTDAGLMYGSDTNRFDAVQTVLRRQLAWRPECLLSPDMIIPENVKSHVILAVHPNLHTAVSSPAFCSKTNAGGDGTLKFYNIHMVNTYVKVETPLPKQVYMPAYNIKSTYQTCSGTSNNLQFTVPKDTYKIVVGLQSSAATINAGQAVTKFSSGSGLAGATQSVYSKFLTGLQLNYAGQNYPATMYTIEEDTAVSKSVEPYLDFLGATDGAFDPSGAESYSVWSDPKVLADVSYGRLFCFNIVKPSTDVATNAELTLNFSTGPTTTRVFLFAISKTAIAIQYGDNHSVSEIKPVPFS